MEINKFRGQYGFLSNFYSAPTMFEGIEYPTSEHAFQAAKALATDEYVNALTGEITTVREVIRRMPTPGDAKRYARTISMRADWRQIRDSIMFVVLMSKFSNPHLQAMLLATSDATLIEGNEWHDNYWGACSCSGCSGRSKTNRLGQLLMLVRDVYARGMGVEVLATFKLT